MRPIHILCSVPDWCPMGDGPYPLGMDGVEFRAARPELWTALLAFIEPFRGPEYAPKEGVSADWWRNDPCLDPEACLSRNWFFAAEDGTVFRKWINDPHCHGESFYFRDADGVWRWGDVECGSAPPSLWQQTSG